jgi:hypothetical protein
VSRPRQGEFVVDGIDLVGDSFAAAIAEEDWPANLLSRGLAGLDFIAEPLKTGPED